jgi:hypothetical protein
VDPDNRLVVGELEFRWNAALQKASELNDKLKEFDTGVGLVPMPDKAVLMSLAQDLPKVWNAPTSDMRLKHRIVRILIHEIVVDVNEKDHEVVLLIHWAGGRHSELRMKKNRTGEHTRCTSMDAIEVMRQMAIAHTDEQIAAPYPAALMPYSGIDRANRRGQAAAPPSGLGLRPAEFAGLHRPR